MHTKVYKSVHMKMNFNTTRFSSRTTLVLTSSITHEGKEASAPNALAPLDLV
jgi:hypothetical protein